MDSNIISIDTTSMDSATLTFSSMPIYNPFSGILSEDRVREIIKEEIIKYRKELLGSMLKEVLNG